MEELVVDTFAIVEGSVRYQNCIGKGINQLALRDGEVFVLVEVLSDEGNDKKLRIR